MRFSEWHEAGSCTNEPTVDPPVQRTNPPLASGHSHPWVLWFSRMTFDGYFANTTQKNNLTK